MNHTCNQCHGEIEGNSNTISNIFSTPIGLNVYVCDRKECHIKTLQMVGNLLTQNHEKDTLDR